MTWARIHRWLALGLLVPLAVWSVTGLLFHWKPGWDRAYDQLTADRGATLEPRALVAPGALAERSRSVSSASRTRRQAVSRAAIGLPPGNFADTNMTVVVCEGGVLTLTAGGFIEVQGTAEGHAFRRDELDSLLGLAQKGIAELCAIQQQALLAR